MGIEKPLKGLYKDYTIFGQIGEYFEKKERKKADKKIAAQRAYEAEEKSKAEQAEQKEIEQRKKDASKSGTILTSGRGIYDDPYTLRSGLSRAINQFK